MKISRNDLADQLALKLTDAMDMDALVDFFYAHHEEYYRKTAEDDELQSTAVALNVIGGNEPLEIID